MKKVAQHQITPRSVLIGVSVAIFVNLASPYTESVGFSIFLLRKKLKYWAKSEWTKRLYA